MAETVSQADIERYLRMAMEAAEATAQAGNHPYGAVIVSPDGEVVAMAANAIHVDIDPSSHAEMNAIRQACRTLGTVSLAGYRLFTNGAPCTMCATVIIQSGISEVWYSAPANPGRTMPTLEAMIAQSGASTPVVHQGILADDASDQLARWENPAKG